MTHQQTPSEAREKIEAWAFNVMLECGARPEDKIEIVVGGAILDLRDLSDILDAALSLPDRSGEWRTMDSAPRDELILLACATWPHSRILGKPIPIKVGGWRGDWQRWEVFGASWHPTHWMPLPAAPASPVEER